MRALFFGILGCLIAVANAANQEINHYTFAVVPQFPPTQIYKEWQPLLKRLNADTGLFLELKIPASIPKFEAMFLRGETDFAYLNPYHAVMAWRAQNFQPLIRDSKLLTGILVVRNDGPKEVKELEGKAIGFPAPNAFGASLYMRALLAEEVGIHIEPRYLETHSNVYRHVIVGDVAAGGGVKATFTSEPDGVKEQLRILYETVGVAPHPIVVRPSVPTADQRKVLKALLALFETPAGRELLAAVRMPTPMAADYERDYRSLEKLRIDKYVVTESK
ncbi:phosphonate transport system substrate-binding protein [Gammaproteobacteria bacterium]